MLDHTYMNVNESPQKVSNKNETFSFRSICLKNVEVNKDFIIEATHKNINQILENKSTLYRILKFCSSLTIDSITSAIENINIKENPYLFIFMISLNNIESSSNENYTTQFIKQLKKVLSTKLRNRPIVIQLTLVENSIPTLCYKKENSSEFINILKNDEILTFEDFTTFLLFFNGSEISRLEIEKLILEKVNNVRELGLIFRFLKSFKFSYEFFDKFIIKCVANGSKNDLLAVLGTHFEFDGISLNDEACKYLSECFSVQNRSVNIDKRRSDLVSYEQNNDNLSFYSYSLTDNQDLNSSILSIAIESSNVDIIDFLINRCTFLIEQLPFEHQIEICTKAFEANKFDILCDLIELSDFPFPKNLQINLVKNEILNNIVFERIELEQAIAVENLDNISKFIDNNPNLRIAYNLQNKSALFQAVEQKKYKAYFYLRSVGFQANKFENLEKVFSKEELAKANEVESIQRQKNVSTSLTASNCSVMLLYTRSLIYNRKISKDEETEYRLKIMKWLNDLNNIKFGSELLAVVSQCINLKIVFDFECYSVENVSLQSSNALGSIYPRSKWIFIGAQHDDENQEQKIKGTLAHEMCHYAIYMIYENNALPYYKYKKETSEKFEVVVKKINKWSSKNSENPDDKCDGIISSVFKSYQAQDFHLELIVRPVHILAQFDNDIKKTVSLELIYKLLFDFYEKFLIDDMKKFNLEKREKVRKFNKSLGLLGSISKSEFKLVESKFNRWPEIELCIITTNVPKLLLIDICCQLYNMWEDLSDAKNVFIDCYKLKDSVILNDLQEIIRDDPNIKIFVDCSKEICANLEVIVKNMSQIYLIVSSDEQVERLVKGLTQNVKYVESNYEVTNMTQESQILLLQTKINFQNNPFIKIIDIFDKVQILDLLDTELLNLILEKLPISINVKKQEFILDKYFKIIFRSRELILKEKIKINITNNYGIYKELCVKDERFSKLISNMKNYYELPLTLKNNNQNKRSSINVSDNSSKIEHSTQVNLNLFQNMNYILISDMAGTGKSWVMMNLEIALKQKYPTKWVTYVDLKQFIKEFKKISTTIEFSNFFVTKILKINPEVFEAKFFLNLYECGKVLILLDGFDEIAPDCADFVSNLALSFESNGGNQLFIATRDYFEIDLQEKLLIIDKVFKLDEFTQQDGTDLIASIWIINDLTENNDLGSKIDNKNDIKNSQVYKNYEKLAQKLINKVLTSDVKTIGMPQLYKMIADIFKDEKSTALELTEFDIFQKFAENLYLRWSTAKGIIRIEANVKSQQHKLNFYEFHEFIAMQSLFPEESKFCGLKYVKNEWPDEEIIACGILTKRLDTWIFPHESFREFFAAELIAKVLKTEKNDEEGLGYFIIFLTIRKYGVIRLFLNSALAESLNSIDIQENKKLFKYFITMDSFDDILVKNLKGLANFTIKSLKKCKYKTVKSILCENVLKVFLNAKHQEILDIFQTFFISYLKINDLKKIIIKNQVLQNIIKSTQEYESFEKFVNEVSQKTGFDFIIETIQNNIKSSNGNIFSWFKISENFDFQKYFKYLKMIKEFLPLNEIFNLIEKCENEGVNLIHIFVEKWNIKLLKIVWIELEKFYNLEKCEKKFEGFLYRKTPKNENILHLAANCPNIEFHETLWNFILKSFENYEELLKLINQKNKTDECFLSLLVSSSKSNIVNAVLNILIKNLKCNDFYYAINFRNHYGQNIFHITVCNTRVFETIKIIWECFQNLCKSDEQFLEVISHVDKFGRNVFHLAAANSTYEIFEYMLEELEKIATLDNIKNLLKELDNSEQNLLQLAAINNKNSSIHELLLETFQKYFKNSEILFFMEHQDINFECIFKSQYDSDISVFYKSFYIEILNNVFEDSCLDMQVLNKMVNLSVEQRKNIFEVCFNTYENWPIESIWKTLENKFISESSQKDFIKFLAQISLKYEFTLHFTLEFDDPNKHESLWKLYFETLQNEKLFINLLTQENNYGENYISNLIEQFKNPVIIKLLNFLETNLSQSNFKCFFQFENSYRKNILHIAICASNPEIVKCYLIHLRKVCEFNENPSKIFETVDCSMRNIFYLVSSSEILDILCEDFESLSSHESIKKVISSVDCEKRNIFQHLINKNKPLEIQKQFQSKFLKYLKTYELVELLKNKDIKRQKYFLNCKESKIANSLESLWIEIVNLIDWNELNKEETLILFKTYKISTTNILRYCTKEMDAENLEIVWNNLKNLYLLKQNINEFRNYITKTDHSQNNILHYVTQYDQIQNDLVLWKLLSQTFKNRKDLYNLLIHKNKCRDTCANTYLSNFVKYRNKDLIKVLMVLKEVFNSSEISNIIKYEYSFRRCLQYCLYSLTLTFEILQFIIEFFDQFGALDEIKNILNSTNKNRQNLLQCCCKNDYHNSESSWYMSKIYSKYFNPLELMEHLKHECIYKSNILSDNIDSETHRNCGLIWEKILKFLFEKENQKELIFKIIEKNVENISQFLLSCVAELDCELFTLTWQILEDFFELNQSNEKFLEFIVQKTEKNETILHIALKSNCVQFHTELWILLTETFKRNSISLSSIEQNFVTQYYIDQKFTALKLAAFR